MSVDSIDSKGIQLHVTPVGPRGQFDDCVKRDLQIRKFLMALVQKVSKDSAEDCLMANHKNVVLTLKFHDDGF
jgi:hypothetical protein